MSTSTSTLIMTTLKLEQKCISVASTSRNVVKQKLLQSVCTLLQLLLFLIPFMGNYLTGGKSMISALSDDLASQLFASVNE